MVQGQRHQANCTCKQPSWHRSHPAVHLPSMLHFDCFVESPQSAQQCPSTAACVRAVAQVQPPQHR